MSVPQAARIFARASDLCGEAASGCGADEGGTLCASAANGSMAKKIAAPIVLERIGFSRLFVGVGDPVSRECRVCRLNAT
jgi:hypothetical protein